MQMRRVCAQHESSIFLQPRTGIAVKHNTLRLSDGAAQGIYGKATSHVTRRTSHVTRHKPRRPVICM
jgi:hypothetical protein